MILQKSAFLAAVPGVELSIHFNQRLGAGLFGGEASSYSASAAAAWALPRSTARWWSTTSSRVSRSWWTPATWRASAGVQMEIRQVPGMKNKLLGGEGLFNTSTGPGRIWLQTMPISGVAAALLPYIPTGNN